MRLTLFAILVSVVQIFATNAHAQQTRLSLNLKNTPIRNVLGQIENQTDFYFIYNAKAVDVEKVVSIEVENESIPEILDKIFEGANVACKIDKRQIAISTNLPESAVQQKITVSGRVTDSSVSPLPGVTVIIKGTTQGIITDANGNYSISNVPDDATLQFSFVGMATQEIQIAGKTSIDVVMVEDAIGIEEVVAVGYGTVTKRDLTGSVAQVKSEQLVQAPVKSFDDALAGRMAGVQVSATDGQPGSLPNIIIRGGNSISQDNSPLYIVDGFPVEDNDNSAINTSDIESVDVLKDASATAIYGARGANGVIIITTKEGREGASEIRFDTYYGIQDDINRVEVLDPYEFVRLQLEINEEEASSIYLSETTTLDDYKDVKGIDWYEKIMRTAPIQNYNLSISGGNDKSKYSVTASYLDQKGIFVNTGFKRYQTRINLEETISKNLKFGVKANYGDTKQYGTVATTNESNYLGASLMNSIWGYRPITGIADGDIDIESLLVDPEMDTADEYRVNPLIQLENEVREKLSSNLMANFYAEYTIIKGLKLRVTGGANIIRWRNNQFNNSKTRTGSTYFPFSLGPNGSQAATNVKSFMNENTLSYKTKINKDHTISALVGFTQQTRKIDSFGATVIQVSQESLGLSGLDTGTPYEVMSSSSNWGLQSLLARVNYGYKSKYLITATMRADGSSKFNPENRWGYFPSGAFAYRLSEEEFIKKNDFISNIKLRTSYGATGSNRVSDFAYLASIGTNYSTGYSFGNQTPTRGTYASDLGNGTLKWETTTQLDLGIDIGLWNERLSLTFDYYDKVTKDILLNADLPVSTGFASAYKNIGKVGNSGIELTINTVNVHNSSFSWNSSFNIAFNRSELLSLSENQEALTSSISAISGALYNIPQYIAKLGQPIAQFYGVVFDGLYQIDDFVLQSDGNYALKPEITGNGGVRTSIRPGDARYRDINNDGLINSNDYTVIGNPNPDFIGGLNNSFKYRGFDLNIFFQFSYGNDVLNANKLLFENGMYLNMFKNQFASLANRWTEENQNTDIPRLNGYGAYFYSSRLVEDASFLRLKTISLGYNFPTNILKYLSLVKSLRLYASAQNLLTWTNYSGSDPEVSTRHSALTPGFDYSPYPNSKTIIFGLNVKF